MEVGIAESSTILTIFRAWALMPFGSLPSLIIEMEDIMVTGEEIYTSSTINLVARKTSLTL